MTSLLNQFTLTQRNPSVSQDAITTLVENSISAEVKNEIEVMVDSGKFEKLILKAAKKFIDDRYSVSDTIDDTIEKAINPFVGSVIADLPDNYFDLILDEAKETLKETLKESIQKRKVKVKKTPFILTSTTSS